MALPEGLPGLHPDAEARIAVRSSREVTSALDQAILLNPDQFLESTDILYAILSQENNLGAFAVSSVIGKSNVDRAQFLALLNQKASTVTSNAHVSGRFAVDDSETMATQSALELLAQAQQLANGGMLDTGHIIATDLAQTHSVILETFSEMKVQDQRLATVIRGFITELRKNPRRQEKPGSRSLYLEQMQTSDNKIIDLLSLAKEGKYSSRVVKPDWLKNTVISLKQVGVTVVATEHDGEATLLTETVAHTLVQEGSFTTMIRPTLASLEDTTDVTLQSAVKRAKGGVLVLPSTKYLENRFVRLGLLDNSMRVLVYASDSQWKKFTAATDPEYTSQVLFLQPPNKKEAIAMLTSIIPEWEKLYSKPNLTLTISPKAIEEAVIIGMQHPGILGAPIQLAVERLVSRAAAELQFANASLKTLADPRVVVDKQIDLEDIRIALHNITGLEVQSDDPKKYLETEKILGGKLKGQPEAIAAVAEVIRKAKAGFRNPKRPIGSFMLLGPSGVGKTELAIQVNEFLNGGDTSNFIRFNMGEFKDRSSAGRFIGSSPGYIGYEEGGQLTESVRRKPHAVILFDEVEKADPSVWDVLLTVLDEGTLTDSHNRQVDFRNTVIFLTGNIGSQFFRQLEKLGLATVHELVKKEVEQSFRVEFLNRVDKSIIFNPLTKDVLLDIVDLQVQELNQMLVDRGQKMHISPEVRAFLAQDAISQPENGARPVKRSVEKLKETLSSWIIQQTFAAGDEINVHLEDGKLVFSKATKVI